MDRAERLQAHQVQGTWVPDPEAHLQSPRDAYHFDWTVSQLKGLSRCSILDVGSWDGWLDFLLIKQGFKVEGVEAIPDLCTSALSYPGKGSYRVHQGFFEDVQIDQRFDVVLAYEVLEHIPLALVPEYVAKMEAIATRRILISLPDQNHQDNPQHLWTPFYALILSMWSHKRNFEMTYKPFHGIPANFLMSWDL